MDTEKKEKCRFCGEYYVKNVYGCGHYSPNILGNFEVTYRANLSEKKIVKVTAFFSWHEVHTWKYIDKR